MYYQWSLANLPTSHWQIPQILCHQNPFMGPIRTPPHQGRSQDGRIYYAGSLSFLLHRVSRVILTIPSPGELRLPNNIWIVNPPILAPPLMGRCSGWLTAQNLGGLPVWGWQSHHWPLVVLRKEWGDGLLPVSGSRFNAQMEVYSFLSFFTCVSRVILTIPYPETS